MDQSDIYPRMEVPKPRSHDGLSTSHRPLGLYDAVPPLLGYDWIAGLLDNGNALDEVDEDYLENLAQFREDFYDDCHASEEAIRETSGYLEANTHHLTSSQSIKAVDDHNHTAQPGYRINSRLFPEQLDTPAADKLGEIFGKEVLNYIRVSVPHRYMTRGKSDTMPASTSSKETQVKNLNSSLSLSAHCERGYELAQPSARKEKHAASLSSSLIKTVDKGDHWPYGLTPAPRA